MIKTSIEFSRTAKAGLKKGIATFWTLAKIMIPVYAIVTFLKFTPVLPAVADFFKPFMKIFGLPGDAALAIVMGNTVNIYAALAVISSIKLSGDQVTILAIMLGISHSLPLEITIVQQMRTKFITVFGLRVLTSLVLGIIMKQVLIG